VAPRTAAMVAQQRTGRHPPNPPRMPVRKRRDSRGQTPDTGGKGVWLSDTNPNGLGCRCQAAVLPHRGDRRGRTRSRKTKATASPYLHPPSRARNGPQSTIRMSPRREKKKKKKERQRTGKVALGTAPAPSWASGKRCPTPPDNGPNRTTPQKCRGRKD